MSRMTVRLPENLRKWLEAASKESGVSMNAELIKALQMVRINDARKQSQEKMAA